MGGPVLPGLEEAAGAVTPRPRGRPKGSTGKRSSDLHRYIEAFYGGMTPGQQMAVVGLVTPGEVKASRRKAKLVGLDPVMVAMAEKAGALAQVLGCTPKEAWDAMRQERAELMPYVHQKRPAAVELTNPDGRLQPIISGLAMVAPVVSTGGMVLEGEAFEITALPTPEPEQVSRVKSHGEGEPPDL